MARSSEHLRSEAMAKAVDARAASTRASSSWGFCGLGALVGSSAYPVLRIINDVKTTLGYPV